MSQVVRNPIRPSPPELSRWCKSHERQWRSSFGTVPGKGHFSEQDLITRFVHLSFGFRVGFRICVTLFGNLDPGPMRVSR